MANKETISSKWTTIPLDNLWHTYVAIPREHLEEHGITINYAGEPVNLSLHLSFAEVVKLVKILRRFAAIEAASTPEK